MIAVATGISGSGRRYYAKRFVAFGESGGKKAKVFNAGRMLIDHAHDLGIRITEDFILNSHHDTILALRSAICEKILAEIPSLQKNGYAILINLHAVFYWEYQYLPSVDYHYWKAFNPDFFVNFINNSDIIAVNLKKRTQWEWLFDKGFPQDFAIERIMDWQNNEYIDTLIASQFLGKKLYLVPTGGNESILFRLFFEPWRRFWYLGMPLTFLHGEENKKERERIDDFAKWLEKYVILIDPRYVEPLSISQLTSSSKNRAVHNNVVGRDLNLLIPECEGMIGFYPKEVASYGENCERAEVFRTNGKTFLIYPSEEFLSPFFTKWTREIFKNEEEFKPRFLEYLGKDYLAKVEEAEKCYGGGDNV